MKGEFQGHHLGTGVSFIVIDASPRSDPKLHRHFYEEIIVVQEGTATFTAGSDIIDSTGRPRRDVWSAWRDIGWPRGPALGHT